MKFAKSFKKSVLICISILCLSGCKIYYDCNSINGQLRKNAEDADLVIGKLNSQISSMLQEYESMNCNQDSAIFKEALFKLSSIKSGLIEMNDYCQAIKSEYMNFTQYSAGKNKIESGTKEWKSFKQTKSIVKKNAKLLQKKGENNIKSATEFHEYVSKNIVPKVKYCDVSVSLNLFEAKLKELGNSQKKFLDDYKTFEKSVSKIIESKLESKKEQCNAISEKIKKIAIVGAGITKIKSGMLQQISIFRKSTSSKTKIYSCSSDWVSVSKAELEFAELNNQLAKIEKEIQTLSAEVQKEINELQ